MARFDRQIETALRLIKKNGMGVIWRQTAKDSDASEPWKQDATPPVDNSVIICFLPTNKQTREFLAYLKGTEVASGSELGLMGNVPFVPALEDIVIRNGVAMRIKTIDLLAPNGQKILYTMEFAQ